ncbi:hypothetical protein ACWDOP_11975 [Nocardia sp. NPDC003693]
MGRIRPMVAMIALLFVVSACGQDDSGSSADGTTPPVSASSIPNAATSTAPVSSSSPSSTMTTAPASNPATPAGLPLCGDTERAASGPSPDCALVSRDRAGLSFVVRHNEAGNAATVTIEVLGRDGAVRQTLTEQVDPGISQPRLLELADDGRDQLVVPLRSGMVNVTYAIYRALDAAPDFVRTGTMAGIGVDRTASGYLAGQIRGGSAGKYWNTEFWRLDGTRLRFVASTLTIHQPDGPATCAPDPDGSASDRDPEITDPQAVQRLCTEDTQRTRAVG